MQWQRIIRAGYFGAYIQLVSAPRVVTANGKIIPVIFKITAEIGKRPFDQRIDMPASALADGIHFKMKLQAVNISFVNGRVGSEQTIAAEQRKR